MWFKSTKRYLDFFRAAQLEATPADVPDSRYKSHQSQPISSTLSLPDLPENDDEVVLDIIVIVYVKYNPWCLVEEEYEENSWIIPEGAWLPKLQRPPPMLNTKNIQGILDRKSSLGLACGGRN